MVCHIIVKMRRNGCVSNYDTNTSVVQTDGALHPLCCVQYLTSILSQFGPVWNTVILRCALSLQLKFEQPLHPYIIFVLKSCND